MSTRNNTSGLLRTKDSFNRMTLQNAWSHAREKISNLKFSRLKHDYGDLRSFFSSEKRKSISEGLKI